MINKENLRSIIKSDITALTKVRNQLAITNKLLSEIEPTKKEILILDDEHQICDFLKDFLEIKLQDLFYINTVNNSDEALNIINKRHNNIVLFHTDLGHPGELHGTQLIKLIRNKYPNIKIIVASGHIEGEYSKYCEKYSEKYFRKAFDLENYFNTVRELLNLYIYLLFPYNLDYQFIGLFQDIGFKVYWSGDEKQMAKYIFDNDIDIAFQWQWGANDHTVRDYFNVAGKKVPIFLFNNWNRKIPKNYKEIGYVDWINSPIEIKEMWEKFNIVLPEHKKKILTITKNIFYK